MAGTTPQWSALLPHPTPQMPRQRSPVPRRTSQPVPRRLELASSPETHVPARHSPHHPPAPQQRPPSQIQAANTVKTRAGKHERVEHDCAARPSYQVDKIQRIHSPPTARSVSACAPRRVRVIATSRAKKIRERKRPRKKVCESSKLPDDGLWTPAATERVIMSKDMVAFAFFLYFSARLKIVTISEMCDLKYWAINKAIPREEKRRALIPVSKRASLSASECWTLRLQDQP